MVLKRPAGRGGMQRQARRVASGMRHSGVPVSLIVGRDRSQEPVDPGWSRRLPVRALDASNQWRFALELYRHLLRYRGAYDVVHVHGFGLETFAAMAARRATGKPLVVKPSTSGPGTKLDRYATFSSRMPGAGRFWEAVDAWVSISEQTTSDLLRMRIPEHRIAYVPNGVNTARYRPLPSDLRAEVRARLGLAPEDLVVCTVCRLTEHKRVDLLLRAFLALRDEHPTARLWIMGDGEERGALEALAGTARETGRVCFWGHLKSTQVARNLQAADVFALLSRWEGLSNALLEAMACGLPPVVSTVSGMQDVIEPGVSGLAVPSDDEPAAREAIHRLLVNASLRATMGAAAAGRARRNYGIERTIRQLLEVYAVCRGRQSAVGGDPSVGRTLR
jgi:glycosyltransferase involved in cell wall biosynthesis